jgi:hypothetical protein
LAVKIMPGCQAYREHRSLEMCLMLAPNPVALNDAQLEAVMTAASNLPAEKRGVS